MLDCSLSLSLALCLYIFIFYWQNICVWMVFIWPWTLCTIFQKRIFRITFVLIFLYTSVSSSSHFLVERKKQPKLGELHEDHGLSQHTLSSLYDCPAKSWVQSYNILKIKKIPFPMNSDGFCCEKLIFRGLTIVPKGKNRTKVWMGKKLNMVWCINNWSNLLWLIWSVYHKISCPSPGNHCLIHRDQQYKCVD